MCSTCRTGFTGDGGGDAGDGTGPGVDGVSTPALADCVLLIVTAWQIGVIATANYTFLNYLVLVLAFLLLDESVCDGLCRCAGGAGWQRRPSAPRSNEDARS